MICNTCGSKLGCECSTFVSLHCLEPGCSRKLVIPHDNSMPKGTTLVKQYCPIHRESHVVNNFIFAEYYGVDGKRIKELEN